MPGYEAYILRIWRSVRDDRCQWRCRIERLPGGERRQFTTPEALLAYLRTGGEVSGREPDGPAPTPAPPTPPQDP